jgi:penicillin-binding protein-related factor A (putative recombinase)
MSKGAGFEAVIEASQSLTLLTKIPNGHKYLRGGHIQPIKGPVDFMGCVKGSARAVVFDAKECSQLLRFPCGDRTHIPQHQVEHIVRYGSQGALAGLLIWAKHPSVGAYYWMNWTLMKGILPSSIAYENLFHVCSDRTNVLWDRVISTY